MNDNAGKIKIERKEVFDFDKAVSNGHAFDQNGDKHTIIASSQKFIITQGKDGENCFNRDGRQFELFHRTIALKQPHRIEAKVYAYLIYDEKTMEIIDMKNVYGQDCSKAIKNGYKVINTTNNTYLPIMQRLGIEKTKWFEEAQ